MEIHHVGILPVQRTENPTGFHASERALTLVRNRSSPNIQLHTIKIFPQKNPVNFRPKLEPAWNGIGEGTLPISQQRGRCGRGTEDWRKWAARHGSVAARGGRSYVCVAGAAAKRDAGDGSIYRIAGGCLFVSVFKKKKIRREEHPGEVNARLVFIGRVASRKTIEVVFCLLGACSTSKNSLLGERTLGYFYEPRNWIWFRPAKDAVGCSLANEGTV